MIQLAATTRLVGILGWPIEHSLSPQMQNAAFAALGLDWAYVALPTPPGSLAEGVTVAGDAIVRRSANGDETLVPLTAVKLLGRHLLADVLAASAVASLIGVDAAAMTKAVEGFTGLEHALEPVGEIGGVRFVNDSKATNIEAARRAVESFGDGVVVVLGGRFKGGDFRALLPPLVERRATVVSIGEARSLIRAALGVVAKHVEARARP